MAYQARIEAHSVNPHGQELVTAVLTYPRFIHAEFLTYGSIRRNASSSRATPTAKLIRQVLDEPAMPVEWGKNRKGMAASESLDPVSADFCRAAWLEARDDAVAWARDLAGRGAHKQVVNRVLEPFAWITVVATAMRESWHHLFNQRIHPAAQPEFRHLAVMLARALRDSTPVARGRRECPSDNWHLPFVRPHERLRYDPSASLVLSTARCARTSYLKHDGEPASWDEDLRLHNETLHLWPVPGDDEPKHASPAEHQALALDDPEHRSGPFVGWLQYRKTIAREFTPDFDYSKLDQYN